MIKRILFISLALMVLSTQKSSAQVYLLSFKHFKESFHNELGFTFFTNYTRSPRLGTEYAFSNAQAFPVPVYTNVYNIASISYEPQFRLIEFGSSNSISLRVPLTVGYSIVDVCVAVAGTDQRPFSPDDPDDNTLSFASRSSILGWGHGEAGGLVSYNLGRNATSENTWPIGVNLGFGYNYTIALFQTFETRSDYAEYLRWGNVVGRLGLEITGIGFFYTLGLDQTTVNFRETNGSNASLETSIYHKFTMTIDL